MDAQYVIYTGVPTPYIPITPNQNLQLILQNIDAAINAHNTAPNYSSYNLGPYNGYSITQTDGVSHPTNTQNFAEGIAKIVCTDEYNLYTFINTTYVGNQSTITSALTALQTPGLTYSYSGGGSSISITSGMTRNQVLTATYTGVGNILALLAAPGTTWSTLSLSTPTTISSAFNELISYLSSLTTTVSGKQATLGTFDNSSNCFSGGTSTDSITTTINLIRTYVCALPTFNSSSITWGGVSSASGLQNTVQSVINSVSSLLTNTFVSAGTGLTSTSNSTYGGYSVAINTSWAGLYKVALTSNDVGNADYLGNKISSNSGTLTITTASNKLNLEVTNPANGKVAVNSSDTANYLSNKLPSNAGDWGMAITTSVSSDNSTVLLRPTIINPELFVSSIMNYIMSDPLSLGVFCTLQNACLGCTCGAPTGLSVALSTGSFVLTWTPTGSASTQLSKYRQRGNTSWITNVNISPVNPESKGATTSTISGLNPNTVWQFQVDSVCTTGSNSSNIYEDIYYQTQTVTIVNNTGVISVSQSPNPSIDNVQYELINGSNVVLQTISTTGLNPAGSFTSVSSGTYTVKYRYLATCNGVTVYSSDSSQLNGWSTGGTVTV